MKLAWRAPVAPAQLLISVTHLEEAKVALNYGADIIDLKEPRQGALGALPVDIIQSVVAYVKNESAYKNKMTSATIGDLPMHPQLILEGVKKLAETDIDIIKIGFFECDDYQPCLDALKGIALAGVSLIAVLFAEYAYPKNLIQAIKEAGFYGVMLDTATKNGLTLLDYYDENARHAFANEVHHHHLALGLAGSLKAKHIGVIQDMKPTYIGFRGGVCCDDVRSSTLDFDKIINIRKAMQLTLSTRL